MATISERRPLCGADEFGDRMKSYEVAETGRCLDASLPIYARLDGRSFSRFTRGMPRPFYEPMSAAMIETLAHLVSQTHARIGYTQSDEISLVWLAGPATSETLFGGKVHKLTSVLASMAAAKFARVCPAGYEDRLPHFDCRVFQLPSRIEAANVLLWRAMDCRKNAISMAAQAHFSHRALFGKRQADMLAMLTLAGVDFEQYPAFFRNGTFARRETVVRMLSDQELAGIPAAHRPIGPVLRSAIQTIDGVFLRDVTDRIGFLFPEAGSPSPEQGRNRG